MKSKVIVITATILLFAVAAFAKKPKPQQNSITFHFNNIVDGQPLRLNDSTNKYSNAHGDDFYVTTFKYYVSNIVLTKTNGEQVSLPDSYFLVNAADAATTTQQINGIPEGKYKSIQFIIGVDSARNFAGAQTGCLDPANGMFWTWKSGYIFVKLEGVSSKSASKKNKLVYHIGGAIAPDNTIRNFAQELPHKLKIKGSTNAEINLDVNAAALFKGNTTVDFSQLSFTMGGPKSVIIADNYAKGLFTVTSVKK